MRSFWLDTNPVPLGPPQALAPAARYETVVAGAGLTGLTTSVLLAQGTLLEGPAVTDLQRPDRQ